MKNAVLREKPYAENRHVLYKKMLLILSAFALWSVAAEVHDHEYWMRSKRGVKGVDADASSQDVAVNVKAQQMEGTKLVKITYDANYRNGWPVNVTLTLVDSATGQAVPADHVTGDIGKIPSGSGKCIIWDAGADWDGKYTESMVATVNAVPAEHPSSWAEIIISWSSFGGRDLDVCGFWEDMPAVKVGWSWSTGSTDSAFKSVWYGDNTGPGPEHISIGVRPGEILSGVTNPKYHVHCNYFGENGSPADATIIVTCNGVTMSKTIHASTRNGSRAEASDPGVTIMFNNVGELVSIE